MAKDRASGCECISIAFTHPCPSWEGILRNKEDLSKIPSWEGILRNKEDLSKIPSWEGILRNKEDLSKIPSWEGQGWVKLRIMTTIQEFVEQDTFAQHLGIELLEASAGYAKVQLTITEKHLNGLHTVHGGVIFTLADVAFAIASNAHGPVAMAINAHISYIKAVTEGTLIAEARETSLNPKLATYTVLVSNDQGNAIAIFQGMVYRKRA